MIVVSKMKIVFIASRIDDKIYTGNRIYFYFQCTRITPSNKLVITLCVFICPEYHYILKYNNCVMVSSSMRFLTL